MKPLITVVICAYNDESTIARVLDAVSRLTYQPLEVLVMNDASTDRTAQIAKSFNVAVIDNPGNMGLGYNQNLGLSLAKGEYMALIQSDCEILQDDWLQQMAELMMENVAVVVSQREISSFAELPAGARLFNAVAPQGLVNRTGKPLEQNYCRGKADLYRVSVLRELNGWNRDFFTAGEDTDLSIRLRKLGQRILLHPSAKVRYLFSNRQATVAGSLRKGFLYGTVAYPLFRLHQYDGIQSRTYAHILVAAVVLVLPYPFNALIGVLVLANSFTARIQSAWQSTSLGMLSLIACVPLVMLNSPHGLRGIAQAIPGGILLAGTAYTGYLAAKNAFQNYRKGEKIHRLPGTFLFAVVWRLASGAGYLAGVVKHHKMRRSLGVLGVKKRDNK